MLWPTRSAPTVCNNSGSRVGQRQLTRSNEKEWPSLREHLHLIQTIQRSCGCLRTQLRRLAVSLIEGEHSSTGHWTSTPTLRQLGPSAVGAMSTSVTAIGL